MIMTNYKPAKLACKIFEPVGGKDDRLNPILFLHGVGGSKENFDDMPQIIADKTKRKAYSLDARNHGDSEFTDDYNFQWNADDLLHFMNTMNISKAVLVGASMGAMTSIMVALKNPERVEVLFAGDMHLKTLPQEIINLVVGMLSIWIAAVQSVPSGISEEEAIKFAIEFMYNQLPIEQREIVSKEKMMKANLRLRTKPDGSYDVSFNKEAVLAAVMNHAKVTSEPSGQFNGPAFFIYGSNSPFNVGKEEEHIKKHFPKAELIKFEGANHDVVGECREKFIDTVLARIQS